MRSSQNAHMQIIFLNITSDFEQYPRQQSVVFCSEVVVAHVCAIEILNHPLITPHLPSASLIGPRVGAIPQDCWLVHIVEGSELQEFSLSRNMTRVYFPVIPHYLGCTIWKCIYRKTFSKKLTEIIVFTKIFSFFCWNRAFKDTR